jgi:hypothetical protein
MINNSLGIKKFFYMLSIWEEPKKKLHVKEKKKMVVCIWEEPS